MSNAPKYIKVKGQVYRLADSALDTPERYLELLNETIGLLRQASESKLYATFPREFWEKGPAIEQHIHGEASDARVKLLEVLHLFRALRDKIENIMGWK